jgi:hypothetical protein
MLSDYFHYADIIAAAGYYCHYTSLFSLPLMMILFSLMLAAPPLLFSLAMLRATPLLMPDSFEILAAAFADAFSPRCLFH